MSRNGRRGAAVAALAAGALAFVPDLALGHAIDDTFRLPVPLWLYLGYRHGRR